MARPPADLTPIQAFLAPLVQLARRDPLIEALVFWEAGGWPDAPSEALESEEMAFYAEGLLEEGFHMVWRVVAAPDAPQVADHVRFYVWEDGADAPPAQGADWPMLDSGTWGATTAFTDLHAQCAAFGTLLFTLTALDADAGVFRRVYTSHPAEYPVSGTKPMTRDGWNDHTIVGRKTFVANTPPEFAKYFFDHELIVSLGLGSCINIPVHDGPGPVLGTVNILAEAGHFTPERLSAYQVLVADAQTALCAALPVALRS